MHDKHLMIDLETLSTENDAAIIAVGAVEFDLHSILTRRLWLLDPRYSPGRRDRSTSIWWKAQDPSVIRSMWDGTLEPWDFGVQFQDWVAPFYDTHWVWAGPSTFDLTILKTFFRQHMGYTYPLNWRMHRDMSTFRALLKTVGIEVTLDEQFIEHDALEDAQEQTLKVQKMLRILAQQFDTRPADGTNFNLHA